METLGDTIDNLGSPLEAEMRIVDASRDPLIVHMVDDYVDGIPGVIQRHMLEAVEVAHTYNISVVDIDMACSINMARRLLGMED